ncbi:hypothetical protein Trydic_g9773 [Trypoxylus dichotomus]
MYLAVTSRPGIAHSISVLSQYNITNSEEHWKPTRRVLRYLKDADWGNDQGDRKSYNGFVFKLRGSAISWETKKQRSVALSSTEAEYMALSETVKEAKFLRSLMTELQYENAITIYNDNQSAQELARNHILNKRTKYIDIRLHFIKEALDLQL